MPRSRYQKTYSRPRRIAMAALSAFPGSCQARFESAKAPFSSLIESISRGVAVVPHVTEAIVSAVGHLRTCPGPIAPHGPPQRERGGGRKEDQRLHSPGEGQSGDDRGRHGTPQDGWRNPELAGKRQQQ